MATEVTMWQAEDGALFPDRQAAEKHESRKKVGVTIIRELQRTNCDDYDNIVDALVREFNITSKD